VPAVRAADKQDSPLYRHMPALDGFRGIAILWVLSLHLPGQMEPGANPIARRGALGVELFFAISGFLVTRSLYQCIARASRSGAGTKATVRDFLARRVARIWPPYFLMVGVAFLGLMFDPTFRENSRGIASVFWTYPAFLANYVIPTHEPALSLTVMWSLCFEEQFYVLLIAMYLLSGMDRLAAVIVLGALASIVARFAVALIQPEVFTPSVMQMQTHWRFDALAWGCLAWVFHERIARFWSRLSAPAVVANLILLVSALICVPRPATPLGEGLHYLVMGPVFAALVSALVFAPNFWLKRVLAWAPLALVGVISYEVYLTHVLVYRVLNRLNLNQWLILYYVISIALALAVGWVFHRAFGVPTQRWLRARLGPRPARA
jgi:peptidoglycan/LPS O-acetylase OafA/YrhL